MRTAKWQVVNSELWIWIDDTDIEHRSDRYPILRQWMEAFIQGSPFILEDRSDDPWVQSHIEAYPGPRAVVTSKTHRYALVGSDDTSLLRSHQAEYGLSWLGGLRVYVLETSADVREQLRAWDGKTVEVLDRFVHPPLVTLRTDGDAEGLHVRPGRWGINELLEQARQAADTQGFAWTALRPEGTP